MSARAGEGNPVQPAAATEVQEAENRLETIYGEKVENSVDIGYPEKYSPNISYGAQLMTR